MDDDEIIKASRAGHRHELSGVWGNVLSSTVRIRNVSRGGIGLETNDALSVGRTYILHIDSEAGGQQLEVVVTWCRFVGTQVGEHGDVVPVFQAGARAQRGTLEDDDEGPEDEV